MTSVAYIVQDQDFQGAAPSATDKVPSATLDSQFQTTKAKVNELLVALAVSIRDDNTLSDQLVRIRNLHPELSTLIGSKTGWQPKANARVASPVDVTIAAPGATLDGVTMAVNDRFIAPAQTLPAQCGIYVWNGAAVPATRATDADTSAELGYAFIPALEGSVNKGSTWLLTQSATDIVTLGTTALTWVKVFSPTTGTVNTIAELKALAKPTGAATSTFKTLGYYVVGDGGGGTYRWNGGDVTADNGGNVIQPTAGGPGRWNLVIEDMLNVLNFGAKGDGVTNDVSAINAANAYLSSLASKGTLYFPARTYFTTAGISIPEGVSWLGEEPGWYYGASLCTGTVIYKQHTSDAITIPNSNTYSQYIDSIGIVGRGAVDTGGSGFVLAKAAACVLRRCNVFHVYVHSFVIGDGTASAYTNTLEDCYSNNPQTGSNFVINSTLFRGHKLISDGGLYGITFSSVATNWSIGECHFEGWKTAGMLISNSQGKTYGKTYLACTYATTLTGVLINGSANGIVLTGLQVAGSGAGVGSIGISIAGTASGIVIRDTSIASWAIGISDASAGSPNRTVIEGCTILTCTKGIYSVSSYCSILNNFFYANTLYDVEHVGGTGGVWSGNKMSLSGDFAFKPTYSGQSGNFNLNCVKNNAGYVSRNSGHVASLANNGTINHGLAAAPLQNGSVITLIPTNVGLTSPVCVYSPDSTKFYATWTGTTPNSFTWEARLVCDF
jgi:hypothetical protein